MTTKVYKDRERISFPEYVEETVAYPYINNQGEVSYEQNIIPTQTANHLSDIVQGGMFIKSIDLTMYEPISLYKLNQYINHHDWSQNISDDWLYQRQPYSDNFITHGVPRVYDDESTGTRNITDFSETDYIELPKIFRPFRNTWEMLFKFKAFDSENSRIIGGIESYDMNRGVVVGNRRDANGVSTPHLWLSSNGTSWDIADAVHSSDFVTELNTWYYLKVQFTGTQYIMSIGTTLEEMTTLVTIDSTSLIFQDKPFYIGYYEPLVFNGEISLTDSYIKIGEDYFWTGLEKVYNGGTGIENFSLWGSRYIYTKDQIINAYPYYDLSTAYENHFIIDEETGENGYRIYSNGIIEQWGRVEGETVVTFPLPFKLTPKKYSGCTNVSKTTMKTLPDTKVWWVQGY